MIRLSLTPLLSCEAMGGDFKNMKTNFRTPLNKKPLNVVIKEHDINIIYIYNEIDRTF